MKTDLSNESLWRRQPTPAERDTLRSQPELELEARLTGALVKIPDAPVPSNFTARVLAAVELEEARARRSHGWTWSWHRLWPRFAMAAAILLFAGVGVEHYETHAQRSALAKKVVLLASLQPPPSVDALENLDAIQFMSLSAHADGELLAVLQ